MRILIAGADGYLGRVAMRYFQELGHEVDGFDNFSKRNLDLSLIPTERICDNGSTTDYMFFVEYDCLIDFAEIPSAPYSMQDVGKRWHTLENNVKGTLALCETARENNPDIHIVKLGTMGEYGTPNIDIEEGWLDVHHNGRQETVLYPKRPSSIYHLSKCFDSELLEFYTRMYGLRVTDLNQGVVYGIDEDSHFYYDEMFGTCLNRFIVQAVAGMPLTVYGSGSQTRGWLNIKDTMECINLAIQNPAKPGEFKVRNQFTEQFSVLQLAEMVALTAKEMGIKCSLQHYDNPRKEQEYHYYNAKQSFTDLGLKPNLLTQEVIENMIKTVTKYKDNIKADQIAPKTKW